jgi:hypothetical protein
MARWARLQVNKLRETVQALCQNTTQLGKCMDYVQVR